MSLPGNGIFVVQGEMAILVTAMRRGWGSHSNQDDDLDALMRAFQDLRDILNQVADLRLLDPNIFLGPFLEVIRSEKTTGPVTCLALSAINKFLCYGLIDPMHVSVPATVENIADSVTHARFVGKDHSSDGVVLMKILQVLRTLVLSPEGAMLTDESICEIMLSCFRICFETRLNELLRRNAEQCLRDMTQLVFIRLPQFVGRNGSVDMDTNTGALLLRKKSSSGRRDITSNNPTSMKDRTMGRLHNDSSKLSAGGLSPMLKTSTSGSHLSTTPVVIGGNSKVLDMQGSISRTPNAGVDSLPNGDVLRSVSENEKTPEQRRQIVSESDIKINLESPSPQSHIRSPHKKHGRHSSMDLAASDNIYITQLVEKCVNASENSAILNCDVPKVTPETEESGIVPSTAEEDCLSEQLQDIENIAPADFSGAKSVSQDEANNSEEHNSEYINPRGVRFVTQDEEINLQPYGLRCVRELFSFLISLCNPIDSVNTSSMVHLGLCLVETALEVGADHLAKYPSLLQLVKDPLCRNLLSLLSSERVSIFALDLQVSFLLFESLRTHLKFQMESFFIKLVEIIMSDCAKNSYELREITHLSLESIGQLWRIPGFCTELYLNYDCDIYCSNLFEDITKLLSKTIVTAGIYNYHTLALDALFTIIDSIEANCHQIKSNGLRNSIESDKTVDSEAQQTENVNMDNRGEIAIDMFDSSETGDESVIRDISQYITCAKMGRHRPTLNLPTPKQLDDVKNRKRWIATGTEYFNQKPEKGIEFLQEHGILSVPLDPLEIAHFLRNNPGLDKKMIGEYISKKKNVESRILATYAASFDMKGLRVDQALRLYLETFRLPGEAPLIFLVMEHFSEHWHESNGSPFANTDAAFRLAYAIIMLNMDQHNHNAKKLNVPMNAEDFVRNLRGCNGPNDFDQKMLEAVFHSIKNEEIVMPAERTGIVKENYLWKVLLRRGATKEGVYLHAPSGAFDKELFMLMWGPTVAALSSIFEKSSEPVLYSRALEGFDKCASIVGQYSLTNELDTLLLSLCKFTGLLSLPEQTQYVAIGVSLGHAKARSALKKVFSVCHRHANSLREGWKHILDVVVALFKGRLLPKSLTEADDFFSPTGKVSLLFEPSQQPKAQESGILSSLYSYIALSSDSNSALRLPTQEESEAIDVASECVMQCNIPGILLTDSKFLQLDSLQELVKCLISAGKGQESQKLLSPPYREDTVLFFLELLIKVVTQNRDRVSHVWQMTESQVVSVMHAAAASYNPVTVEKSGTLDRNPLSSIPLERATTGLLRLAICLMRSEECASDVLRSLKALLDLSYLVYHSIASRIAVGLFELVKTSAQNIHSADDWAIVFTLLETTGAGAMHLKQDENTLGSKSDGAVSSEDDSVSTDRGYTSDSELSQSPQTQGWILVGKNAETGNVTAGTPTAAAENPLIHPCALRPHDPYALLKCWECLVFIVRDVAHITPYNFESCVNCIRTFVEASLHGTNEYKVTSSVHPYSGKDGKRKKQAVHSRRTQKQQNAYDRSDSIHDNDRDDVPDGYQLISIQLLDLMHTLHSRTAQIFKWWREESNLSNLNQADNGSAVSVEWCDLWHLAWQPLLQGIARLCTDNRRQVSNSAVTYLQRALLVHDLQTLSGEEWEACFHGVLFPLLGRLTKHHDEIRLRANTIMCKVFLHHLTPLLSRPSFPNLWLSLLDLMKSTMTGPHTTDLLYEATLESLKNMLLVMDSVKVFNDGDNYSNLWNLTWDRINSFIPNLKDDLFKPLENPKLLPSVEDKREALSPTETTSGDVMPSIIPPSYRAASTLLTYTNSMESQSNLSHLGQIYKPVAITVGNPSTNIVQNQTFSQSHSIGNKGSSIILQPPSQLHTPLFSHLGQMVSTPIGVAVPAQSGASPYPILCPTALPQKYYNPQLQNVGVPPQLSHQNNQIFNPPLQQNANIGLPPSQFTLISPRHTQAGGNQSDPGDKSNLMETQNVYNESPRYEVPLKVSQDYPQQSPEVVANIDTQQPRSLYGEYLTDPYNPSLEISHPKEKGLLPEENISNMSQLPESDGNVGDIDRNFNFAQNKTISNMATQKSHSVNSSPLRSVTQTNVTFGSSDNIKNMGRSENSDTSGMFSFSKYFYTDSNNIPPGSEILYGDSFVFMNEG